MTKRRAETRLVLITSLLLLAGGCSLLGAQDQRLIMLENQIDSLQKSQEEYKAERCAQVEEFNNTLSMIENDIRGMKSDLEALRPLLDDRGREETPGESSTPETAETAESLYGTAFAAYRDGRYQEALGLFHEFVSRYPDDALADNALYWRGESYYALQDYEQSIEVFGAILREYGGADKEPDALLKIGLAYLELRAKERARPYFDQLLETYPDTEAAGKARLMVEGLSE